MQRQPYGGARSAPTNPAATLPRANPTRKKPLVNLFDARIGIISMSRVDESGVIIPSDSPNSSRNTQDTRKLAANAAKAHPISVISHSAASITGRRPRRSAQ
jgi:hypothetical protein